MKKFLVERRYEIGEEEMPRVGRRFPPLDLAL
jgi:hypothetical protein